MLEVRLNFQIFVVRLSSETRFSTCFCSFSISHVAPSAGKWTCFVLGAYGTRPTPAEPAGTKRAGPFWAPLGLLEQEQS